MGEEEKEEEKKRRKEKKSKGQEKGMEARNWEIRQVQRERRTEGIHI